MPYEVVMPQLGMTMTEGTVVEWLKKPGDVIAKGEFLFIVQTDKVDMEVESLAAGTFAQIVVQAGDLVPVGTVIGLIAQEGEAVNGASPVSTTEHSPAETLVTEELPKAASPVAKAVAPPAGAGQKLANPRAKKLARDLGIDIALVPSYEGVERITEADVQRFVAEHPAAGPQNGSRLAAGAAKTSASRKIIAERLTASFQTVPHFYLDVLADVTELVKLRQRLLGEVETQSGVRLTYTDLLLKALALAVGKHPQVNAFWQDGVVAREKVHVGFAAQAEDRLMVPVIRDADQLGLSELAKVRSALTERMRGNKLRPEDISDASCTLSNLGKESVDSFHAIINPPESLIVAAGSITSRPVVLAGAVVPRDTMYLSLSVDHRVVDGRAAAEFLGTLKSLVEAPGPLAQNS